jgi:Kelch motif
MTTVAVYDIANQVWYEQATSGTPPGQLTLGCAVVASAQDGSSHNIYWYGGFDGLKPANPYSDDVWVLSVPSFMWMKVKSGTPSHGRAGHKCVKPYPDQMFVIGGYPSLAGNSFNCLEGNIIQVFNLSSLQWIEKYDPNVWSNYTVPAMIYDMIGGTGKGSATQTAPSSTVTANASMIALFQQQYNTSKITTWYPYHATTASSSPRPTLPSAVAKPGSGTPKFLAPVLGVILGLVFITCLVVAIMLYRRRKLLSMNGTATQSENGTVDPRRGVLGWLRTVPADAKAPTVTTDETPTSPYDEDNPYLPQEIGGGQVHEMMGMASISIFHFSLHLTKVY